MKKNILITGSGGREHALAWKLSQSNQVGKIFVAPGNAGTASDFQNVALNPSDFETVAKFCKENQVHLLVAGSEQALVDGIYDFLKQASPELKVWGPSKAGALLEGSKAFSKEFMERYAIPTAKVKIFRDGQASEAIAFISSIKGKIVLKADGLAAGKGVIITEDVQEAKSIAQLMLSGALFGEAGATLLIEEFLEGIEVSYFIMTDGNTFVTLPQAKDYKRVGNGDTGLNTGGMGAVSPVGFCDGNFLEKVEYKIVKPTIYGLQKEGIDYKGFLFIGLMKVGDEPYVIEYNVRLGDPETEAILPRIQSDLFDWLWLGAEGALPNKALDIAPETAITVIIASKGYPGPLDKGYPIHFEAVNSDENTLVFHAGTALDSKGKTINIGGRVLACTALGANRKEAKNKAYLLANSVHFEGAFFRNDISNDLEKWDG